MANKHKRGLRKIERTLQKALKPIERIAQEESKFNDWTLYEFTKEGYSNSPLFILREQCRSINFHITNDPINDSSSTHTQPLTILIGMMNDIMTTDVSKITPSGLMEYYYKKRNERIV